MVFVLKVWKQSDAMNHETMDTSAISRVTSVADAITSISLGLPSIDLREIVRLDSHSYRLLLVKRIMDVAGIPEPTDDAQRITIVQVMAILAYIGSASASVKRLRKIWDVIRSESGFPDEVNGIVDNLISKRLVDSAAEP